MITLRYFARLKEVTGKAQETLPFSAMTVKDLIDWADRTYDGFSQGKGSMHVAINEEYAGPDDSIRPGDVIAFIPPVSGG